MSYTLQFNKTDTLATTLLSGATSTTLTTGNFGSPSGVQLYVVDWDVPAKAEIISASVSNTSVTGITRGLTGGSAATTDHQVGAKIASIFVPQHYQALVDGSGWSSSAIGLGTAGLTAQQNLNVNETALAGMSKTVVVPPGGRSVRIYINIYAENDNDNTSSYTISVKRDGNTVAMYSESVLVSGINLYYPFIFQDIAPTAGSHTYSITAQTLYSTRPIYIRTGTSMFIDLI
jgi:hypothetical protein